MDTNDLIKFIFEEHWFFFSFMNPFMCFVYAWYKGNSAWTLGTAIWYFIANSMKTTDYSVRKIVREELKRFLTKA